jgi:trehalose-6-phosphatase
MPKETFAAYLGDDYTDEDAFEAIKNRGVGILVRKEFRLTRADIWLEPPEELLFFLGNWIKKGI